VRLRAHSSRTAAWWLSWPPTPGGRGPGGASPFWTESTDAQALTNLRRELHYQSQMLRDEPSLALCVAHEYLAADGGSGPAGPGVRGWQA